MAPRIVRWLAPLAAWLLAAAPALAVGPVRVGLLTAPSVQVACSVAAEIQDDKGHALMRIGGMESWMVTTDGARVTLMGPSGQNAVLAGTVRLRPPGPTIPPE